MNADTSFLGHFELKSMQVTIFPSTLRTPHGRFQHNCSCTAGKQLHSPGLHQTCPDEGPAPGTPSSSTAVMAGTQLMQAGDLLLNAAQAPAHHAGACCREPSCPGRNPSSSRVGLGEAEDGAPGSPAPPQEGCGCLYLQRSAAGQVRSA